MSYDPNKLIDFAIIALKCRNDAGLARLVQMAPSHISKIRIGKLPLGAVILIELHELMGLSTKELRAIAGCRRKYFRQTHNKSTVEQRLAA